MPTLRILGVLGGLLLAGTVWWVASAGETGEPGSEPATETLPANPVPATDPSTEVQTLLVVPVAEPMQLSPSAAAPPEPPGCTVEIRAFNRQLTSPEGLTLSTRLKLGVSPSRKNPKDLGEPLQLIETDADGRAVVELPWHLLEAPADGKTPWVWILSDGPGLLTRVASHKAPKEPGGSIYLSLSVQPGVLVEGRILGPDGEPVAGRVDWWSFGDEGVTSSRVGNAGFDGRFSGELTREGPHGLLAQGNTAGGTVMQDVLTDGAVPLGTGFSEIFDVRFDEPVPFIEVQVSGPGVIRGRVLDAQGAPAAGVHLIAIVASLDREASEASVPYSHTRDIDQEGRGHARARMTTDTEGAFEARGLRDDLFNVRAEEREGGFSGFPLLLTPQPVPSHGEPLTFRLTRPHLAIHVTRADGSAPPDSFRALRVYRDGSDLDGWPDEPRLLVSLAQEDLQTTDWTEEYLSAKSTDPGEFIVELDDDVTVCVGVLGGDLPWRPLQVDVPPGAGRVDVDLVMPEPAVPGTLVLNVLDSGGEAVLKQVQVRVTDPTTGVILVNMPFNYTDEDDWPMRLPLPDGEYQLIVEGHPWIDNHHGTVMKQRSHGGHEQTLLISPAHETHVTASLNDGARLSLRVLGVTTEADRQAVRDWDPREDADEFVDYWAPHVGLHLERPGHRRERVDVSRYTMEGTSAAGNHLISGMDMGSEGVSEMLSPGEYTLVATTQGGRSVRREVLLIAGQTLAVTLHFH